MKLEMKLFSRENYDRKNKLNRSSKKIDVRVLDKIEERGITLEELKSLGVPIFRYQSQITIHGIFPSVGWGYVGGYKLVFQNKNKSIGVKWQAIDYEKKKRIYSTVRKFSEKWNIERNSKEFMLFKYSKYFHTKSDYIKEIEAAKESIKHVDQSLFYGSVGVNLYKGMFGYFVAAVISIDGVYEKNVIPVIENICQAPIGYVKNKIEQNELAKQKEREASEKEWERKRNDRKQKKMDAAKILERNGYTHVTNHPISKGLRIVTTEIDYSNESVCFLVRMFDKNDRQKKFRYLSDSVGSINDIGKVEFGNFGFNASTYPHVQISGWIKK